MTDSVLPGACDFTLTRKPLPQTCSLAPRLDLSAVDLRSTTAVGDRRYKRALKYMEEQVAPPSQASGGGTGRFTRAGRGAFG